MINSTKFTVLFLFFFLSLSVFSQDITPKLKKVMLIKTSPEFTLQLNLNYNQAMGQLAGTFNDDFQSDQFIQGRSLGADKGFGLNVTGKYKLDNMGHIRLLFSGQYNRIVSYLFTGKKNISDLGSSKFNILSGGIGLEDNFTPNHKVKIYLGAEALFSWINGGAKIWVKDLTNIEYSYTYDMNILSSFRIGGVLHGGAEYMLNSNTAFNLGFNLTHANLLLRNSENSGNIYETPLVDDESSPSFTYSGKKNLTFITISAGVCFYFGVYEKRYVLTK